MLDLKLIREDPERVRAALERRRAAAPIDELLELDARRRELLPELEGLRAEQNRANQAIAEAKRSSGDASEAIEQMRGVAARVKEMSAEVAEVDQRLEALMAALPNLPAESAPAATTWSCSTAWSTWTRARACRARASPTCAGRW